MCSICVRRVSNHTNLHPLLWSRNIVVKGDRTYYCYIWVDIRLNMHNILYSLNCSRDPIFVEGPCSKTSQSNFRRWTFQNCMFQPQYSMHIRISHATIMVIPPADHACAGHCTDFYFVELIFVDCCSNAKTAKIGSLKNFRLYGVS